MIVHCLCYVRDDQDARILKRLLFNRVQAGSYLQLRILFFFSLLFL